MQTNPLQQSRSSLQPHPEGWHCLFVDFAVGVSVVEVDFSVLFSSRRQASGPAPWRMQTNPLQQSWSSLQPHPEGWHGSFVDFTIGVSVVEVDFSAIFWPG